MESPRGSPFNGMAYEPPLSLWSLVETHVPASERDEVKDMLDVSLVQQSLELHDEVNMLLEIWRDYRKETDELTKKLSPLPEPPALRDRLKQEIKFFVQSIKEKQGRDAQHTLAKHNAKVLEYVMENKRPGSAGSSRPSTARSSRDGRETPMLSPGSDRMSMSSTVSDEIDSMDEKLNVLKLDEVVQHLRETLENEVNTLLRDISYLQSCLDDEADFRSTSRIEDEEPSLADLRGERSKLEKELIQTNSGPAMPDVSDLKSRIKTSPKNLILSSHSGQSQTPLSNGKLRPASSTRSGPMKASHSISPQMMDTMTTAQLSPSSPHSPDSLQVDIGPSHLTLRTSKLPSRSARLVKVASIPAPSAPCMSHPAGDRLSPSPPSLSKPPSGRPGSANRFRKMVMECRDGT